MTQRLTGIDCELATDGHTSGPDVHRATQLRIGLDNSAAPAALDELFRLARRYRTSQEYFQLLRFVSRFRAYAPFNAMLVHVQRPGARYVASASRWQHYRRRIRSGANPLVILQPMGPVMFVFV